MSKEAREIIIGGQTSKKIRELAENEGAPLKEIARWALALGLYLTKAKTEGWQVLLRKGKGDSLQEKEIVFPKY